MRQPRIIAILAAALAVLSTSCADDDDSGPEGWTDETCADHCEETFAEDLEASPISWFTSEADGDSCECVFLPCDTGMCTAWCVENEGIEQGVCQLLECECVED